MLPVRKKTAVMTSTPDLEAGREGRGKCPPAPDTIVRLVSPLGGSRVPGVARAALGTHSTTCESEHPVTSQSQVSVDDGFFPLLHASTLLLYIMYF